MGQLPFSTVLLHRLCTTSQRHQNATSIKVTNIDYHLVDDLSQKAAVDLGSRIPSLALDTTLAPENPRTK